MGAWEAGPFENDAAMDWVADLERIGAQAVRTALSVAADGYLEAPEGEEAVAAAEVVASALGEPGPTLPDDVKHWIAANPGQLSAEDVTLARGAMKRVVSEDSELKELWVDDAEDEEWPKAMEDLQRRLADL
jgi:uncharacterized protein DUF4259